MELLHQLGIEPGKLLINVVGFLCLLWFMKRFAFGPVSAFMGQRTAEIERQLSEARELHEQAEAERARLAEELEHERESAREEIARVTREAKQAIEELQREARHQRQLVVEQGRAELERNKQVALAELKASVSDIAVEISERVLRESLDEERQGALLDKFLEDVRHASRQGEGR